TTGSLISMRPCATRNVRPGSAPSITPETFFTRTAPGIKPWRRPPTRSSSSRSIDNHSRTLYGYPGAPRGAPGVTDGPLDGLHQPTGCEVRLRRSAEASREGGRGALHQLE